MNVLVVGGAGYIGSHCVRQLSAAGHRPVVLDSLVYGHRKALAPGVPLQPGDLVFFGPPRGGVSHVGLVVDPSGEMVDGLRNLDDGYIPPIFIDNGGAEILDRKTIVKPRESIEWTRRLSEVGIFAGISSGAAVAGAVRCAKTIESGTIVVVAPDGGWKYLSTGAYSGSLQQAAEKLEHQLWA